MNTLTAHQPTLTKNQLLYSKSAIARTLNVSLHDIEKYEIWQTGVWVKLIDQKPTIVSFKSLKQNFVDFRKNNIHHLVANQDSHNLSAWDVYNPQKESWYRVQFNPHKITCTCADWQEQNALLSLSCCKHIYKVLHTLGYDSLKSYLAQKQVA
jgi:hypothetical protein